MNFLEVREQIEEILREIPSMSSIIEHIPLGGKMLRPKLSFVVAKHLGVKPEKVLDGMVAVELIHLASLLHDDVIDEAKIRRGRASLRRIVGNKTAVSVGDLLMVLAFKVIKKYGIEDLNNAFADTLVNMANAEIIEYENTFNFDMNWEEYFSIASGKTGELFGLAASVPAFLAKVKVERFYDIGKKIGTLYQVMDDILDLSNSAAAFENDTFKDVENGVISFPLLVMKENCKTPKLLEKAVKTKNIKEIVGIIEESKCVEESFRRLNSSVNDMAKSYPWLSNYLDEVFSLKQI